MNRTLLKLTQDILSAMDSDEVNSIGDTVESRQVANVIEVSYNNICARTEFPEHKELFELQATGDPLKPNLFYIPQSVDTIDWLKYNEVDGGRWKELTFKSPDWFIEDMYNFGVDWNNDARRSNYTLNSGDSSIEIYYQNDLDPTYYTIIPHVGVILNAVDLRYQDTAQKTRTLAYGTKNYNFIYEDNFTFALDNVHMNILTQEAKSLAFAELKQTTHALADRSARESRITAQRRKDAGNSTQFYRQLPNYGRC